jgi:sulfite exporter TauE/SafE
MNGLGHSDKATEGRLRDVLMVCCAVVLFVLGVWLLIEPKQAHGSILIDNVDAHRWHSLEAKGSAGK